MIPINVFDSDIVHKETETEKKIESFKVETDSGWNRVKRIFEVDEFGGISPEAHSILQVGAMSSFVGAMYGGIMSSRTAYLDFMQNNQATAFKDHLDAKKKLQDKVTLSFGRGAFRWGWRLTLFSTTFVAVSTMVSAYRGKTGVLEYVAGGGASGVLYKFNMGPRGWIVGGGLGVTLGLICGGMTVGILKMAGISMEEARYWQYHWKDNKDEYFKKGVKEYIEQDDFAVIKLHNLEVGDKGKDIDVIDDEEIVTK